MDPKRDTKRFRMPEERVGTLSNASLPPPATPALDLEGRLWLQALRTRDEAAFERLVERYYSPMIRLAMSYVRSREEAEEVVQDTWLGVLAGIDRFEGRSSLKTWIFRILVNRARTRAKREARTIAFSSLPDAASGARAEGGPASPSVDSLLRARPDAERTCMGEAPAGPDAAVLGQELWDVVQSALGTLPPRHREVVTLRDVEGWTAAEVCDLLGLSEANQRVLLHRGRLRMRAELLPYLAEAR